MKTKVVLLFLLISVGTTAFSKGNDPKQEEKKTTKSKYDFNVFKLISIDSKQHQTDSTKTKLTGAPSSSKEIE